MVITWHIHITTSILLNAIITALFPTVVSRDAGYCYNQTASTYGFSGFAETTRVMTGKHPHIHSMHIEHISIVALALRRPSLTCLQSRT